MKYTVYVVMQLHPLHPSINGNCSKKTDVYTADTKKEAFKWLKKRLTKKYASKDVFFTIEEEN